MKRQKTLYENMLTKTTTIKIVNFEKKSVPSICLKSAFLAISGRPPSKMPCGQISLQKYGLLEPKSSLSSSGMPITKTARITYFM